MANNPTIVAASLSSDALESSINKLVQTVNAKTDEMAKHLTDKVAEMEKAIKNLGNVKLDGGTSSSGSTKKVENDQKSLEEQTKKTTQAVKEQTYTYDQLAEHIKSAAVQAEKRYAVTDIQQLRMRQHEITAELSKLEGTKLSGAIREFNELKQKSEEVKSRIAELQSLMSQFRTNEQKSAARQEIENLRTQLMLLNGEMSRIHPTGGAEQRINSLRLEYEQINRRISQMAQELISAEEKELGLANSSRQYTTELDKQLQKIKDLNSAKEAKAMFVNIAAMPIDTFEQAMAKVEAIRALMDKVKDTPLMGKADFEKLKNQFYATNEAVRLFGVETSKSSEKEVSAAKQTEKSEKERREEILRTGQAAQESSRKIINALHQQAADSKNVGTLGIIKDDNGQTINYINQLRESIVQMRRAYFDMSESEKTSPIGRSLEEDIKRAEKAYITIQKYNWAAMGQKGDAANSAMLSSESSLNSLRGVLKQLTSQYNALTIAEIRAGKGDAIINHFQNVSRAAQVLQRQLSTPISFEAANSINVRSLDDMAYKMRMLQTYKQSIDLTKPSASNDVKQVDDAIIKLQKDMDKYMSKGKEVEGVNNALGRSWNYMKNRLAFYFTVGASTQFIKNLIEVRSQYEMNERALGILIDSAERGTQIFNELSQMALVSPYTLIELSTAAKQLTAYDIAAKDVVDTTRRLADMAAAVGIPIERLTYALGQIKAYGYLNSRDARMFANAGIPLVKQLSEYYTELEGKMVSTADVYDRIKKKAIDFNEVMEVINHMTDQGGKFFDFQAKMPDTLKVRLANLTLAWNNMLNDIGASQQGILTWGIGALRDLFKHWKEIDKAIKSAAWVLGIKVAFDFLLLGLNRAGLALGMWTHKMALSEVVGKRLAATMISLGRTMASLASSRMTWITLAVMTTIELISALNGADEAQRALNESIRKGAEDNYNNITKFLEQYKDVRESLYETRKVAIGNIYDPSSRKAAATAYSEESFAKDIDDNEAKKAWEAIREQIELTTASSDKYIQSLLSIKNMSERIRQGFTVLEDIQTVNAALKELGEDTIKVEKDISIFFNLLDIKDGLINNLKDYEKELDNVIEKYGSIAAMKDNTFLGGKGSYDLNDYQTALERLREDLKVTTDSIINFIELKGWSGDVGKINQVFEQISQKLILDNQLDPQKAFLLQTGVEEARSEAAKKALLQRINDEKAALAQTAEEERRKALVESINANIEEYNNWNDFNGRKKVEWERFTKWLKEQHISETTAMFRNMDAEDIKSLNFQEGKHAQWVNRMVTQYAKEHKMSYDDAFNYLKSWVSSANQWSVFIPLIISTEDKKSVYDQLGEYDKLVDEADAQIERLTKRIDELKAKKELDKKETEELTKAEKELADAQKSKADAEAHGGHGKKEKKDERAAAKAQKAAESELQKALKEELQLIDKVRSQYKKLTDAGVNRTTAITSVTTQFWESINHINKILSKNNIPRFDIRKFAGTDDPHKLLQMLKEQIDKAKLAKNIKPEEIQELQVKYSEVVVDAESYNATKIKKGLDNELGRLKDEYELAVELNADPEFGNMFADMFDIDLDTIPKTAQEYAEAYTKSLNKYFKEMKKDLELPNMLSITKDDMAAFQRQMEEGSLEQKYFELIQKAYDATQAARKKETTDTIKDWNKLIEKYAEYEAKVTKIHTDAEKERETARRMNAPRALFEAIDLKERQQLAKVAFEKFQGSSEWIVATGNLEGMTKKAIGGLIDSIEGYKKKAKDLDPKQIKQINNALKALHKEQRKNNPFKALADAMDEAKDRSDVFQAEIDAEQEKLNKLSEAMIYGGESSEQLSKAIEETVERIKELKKKQEEASELNTTEMLEYYNSIYNTIKQTYSVFSDMIDKLGGSKLNNAFNKLTGMLDKISQGAQIGSAFGAKGAAIGAFVGALSGIASEIADSLNGNEQINDDIEDSILQVKRLQNEYKTLSDEVERAYGIEEIAAKKAAEANKQVQLAELKRQLILEQSRKSKNQDTDKIEDLKGQIIDLELEIQNSTEEMVNSLLGISGIGDAAESLVSSMIDAFKSGEDYMGKYVETFNNMIDNMIMKSIVGRVIGEKLEQMFKQVEEFSTKRADETKFKAEDFTEGKYSRLVGDTERTFEGWMKTFENWLANPNITEDDKEETRKWIENLKKMYEQAATPSVEDIKAISEKRDEWQDEIKDTFDAYMEALGITYGQDASKSLSALQQGIQGITEDTAGALEAYMNGVSQQVYLQSEYLRQIAEVMTRDDNPNDDVKVASLSMILLQLQTSYQVQVAIQSRLDGWSSDNERAVRVEMVG